MRAGRFEPSYTPSMKLYTKRGDAGQTDLFGGGRVGKDSLRIDAIGAVDELNSFIGLAVAACDDAELGPMFGNIQSRLFEIGADLASPRQSEDDASGPPAIPRVSSEEVAELEDWIDRLSGRVPPMTHFVLPGGSELAARLHAARTVCRRAERICVALQQHEPVGREVVIYLNRLSDLLFAMARYANKLTGVPDVPWVGPQR